MDKGKEFSISKINKYMEGKRKIGESKINWLNLSQLNEGVLSPTNGKSLNRISSQDKEKNHDKEKTHTKENQLLKSDNFIDMNLNKENNNIITSKGKIINYIMKNDKRGKINTNIVTNNSTVVKSKSAKKLIENTNVKKSNNNTNNTSIFKNNSQNVFSNTINISNPTMNNYNQTIEKFLAKEILQFLEDMKNLQVSICNKEPNIKELKKNFEKKKSNLYQEALKCSKNEINNQILQDNRSYSSFFSCNSAITTGTPLTNSNNNMLNYNNQNVKELTDSIFVLRTALEDIKSNSQFITSQLRTEINNLNDKVSKQMNCITQYEKNINNNLNSIKGIYKLLKPLSNPLNLNSVMDSLQSQNSFINSLSQQENKFDWYENEIKKLINCIDTKLKLNNQTSNNENSNNNIIDQKSSIIDINDPNKLYLNIKNSCNELIEMIRPFINEEENENELNSIFETKDNFEDDVIMNGIENLKKLIKQLISQIENLNLEKEKLEKELNESKIQCDSYKNALNNTVLNKIKYEKNINSNEEKILSDGENYRKLNNDLLQIQNSLLQKLEMKDIENEKNQETIKELLQLNTQIEKDEEDNNTNNNDTSNVSIEKYRYLLNLFCNEQDENKQLKNDYLHLIQDLSNYIENGTKISLNINKLNYNSNKRTTNEFNIEEEPDSIDLGRINENDLLTDKSSISNQNFRINSRESRGSNCASFNRYNNNVNKIASLKQINNLKIDIKQLKSEVEILNKKLNDANDILATLSNAVIKLFYEVEFNNKGKELFNLIFKLLNYSEDKINKLFLEKEKIKK